MGVGLTSTEKNYLADPTQYRSSYRSKLHFRVSRKVLASVELLLNPHLEVPVDGDVVERLVGLLLDNDQARFTLFDIIRRRLSNERQLENVLEKSRL